MFIKASQHVGSTLFFEQCVNQQKDCHHGVTASAAMTSVKNGGSSDAASAYQRAIAREESEPNAARQLAEVESSPASLHSLEKAKSENEREGDDDLYRHHSRQQSVEGG